MLLGNAVSWQQEVLIASLYSSCYTVSSKFSIKIINTHTVHAVA